MEIENINQFLDGKTFLVTGATGLLAKILIEKLLRFQPNLKKLYILVREKDGLSAKKRLEREIIDTELFHVLRGKWGTDFDSLILQKVVAVAGDSACENLGVHDRVLSDLYQLLIIRSSQSLVARIISQCITFSRLQRPKRTI
ncbi:hypothetical protein Droror1_Dr00014078 [Drosera rotundifolia]